MFEDKVPEKIKGDILSQLTGEIQTREGSFADDMAGPLAVELFKMYTTLEALESMVWVNETSGKYLDMAAEDLGMVPRKMGTQARVVLEMTGRPGVEIPKGTTFLSEEGLYFDVEADRTIPESGVLLAAALAREIGEKYNVEAGTVTKQFVNIGGLTKVTNPEAAEGGTDVESDRSLFARIVAARQRPSTSGNKYHYEEWAMEVPGVGAVRVFPLWQGPGTVKVLIADESRRPVDGEIVAACAKHIEEERPIGPTVTVLSAEPFPINITASVLLEKEEYAGEVELQFAAAIGEYFGEIALNKSTVSRNHVGAVLLAIEGVSDYRRISLNGQARSVELTENQIPVLGEVNLRWI